VSVYRFHENQMKNYLIYGRIRGQLHETAVFQSVLQCRPLSKESTHSLLLFCQFYQATLSVGFQGKYLVWIRLKGLCAETKAGNGILKFSR
jgi:hypothetical protein